MSKKGFTLIELLIVIAILAILAAAVLIVINPAELLRRSRDSKRVTDLDTLKSAVNYYITDKGSLAQLDGISGTANAKCKSGGGTATLFYSLSSSTYPNYVGATVTGWTGTTTASNIQSTNGTGWVPINFTSISAGSPLSVEPVDPSDSAPASGGTSAAHLYYVYACDASDLTFEITANMESALFKTGGPQDVESKDGGQITTIYEVGTKLTIQPSSTSTFYYGSE